MSRRHFQQPRAPGQPRCVVQNVRNIQEPRRPSEGRCHNDYRMGYQEGGTGQGGRQAAIDALTDVATATNGHVLTKDATTGSAIFAAPSGGGGGALTRTVEGVAVNTVLDETHDVVLVTTGASTIVIDLPVCSTCEGRYYTVKKIDSGAGEIVITPDSTAPDGIDGAADLTISIENEFSTFVSDGSNWWIIG